MQKMFQNTYPVGTKVIFKREGDGKETEGEVEYSSNLIMRVKVTSEGPIFGHRVPVTARAFVRAKGE